MNTEAEILEFIKTKENTGALLLKGQWGCGKSYLIKSVAEKLNTKQSQYYISIISLFGIDNIAILNRCVKEAYLAASSGFFTKTVKSVSKGIGAVIKGGAEIASAVDPTSGVAAGLAKGFGNAITLNMFDYIPVKSEFGRADKKKKFVLVFDDFERCGIDIIDLLGVINDYCENKKIKTILVADESKLLFNKNTNKKTQVHGEKENIDKNELSKEEKLRVSKYKEFKEKLIFSTIKLETNYNAIIDNIINNYDETVRDYKAYLQQKEEIIKKVFYESQYNNVRTVKKIVVLFERVFGLWLKTNLSIDYLENIFYTFSADMYENSAGNLVRGEYGNIHFGNQDLTKKYSNYGGYHSNVELLKSWILEGDWDEDKLKKYLIDAFNPKTFTDKHKFLNWYVWDLDETTLQNGYKEALKDLYNGECDTAKAYGWTMERYEHLKELGIPLQPELDYQKLEHGLSKQFEKIKNGEKEISWLDYFVSTNDLKRAKKSNVSQYNIYKKLGYAYNAAILWSNQFAIIKNLENQDGSNFYDLYNKNRIEKLEKKLCEVFLAYYKEKNNRGKTDLIEFFEKLILIDTYSHNPITKENIDETKQNLQYLKEEISKLLDLDKDSITKCIHKRFLNLIEEKFININDIKITN